MRITRASILATAILAAGCGSSLGDAARLWCRDNQPAVFDTGVRLGVYKAVGDGPTTADQLLAIGAVKSFDGIEKDGNYVRACTAAYEGR